jgi:hypothetical protein
MHRNVIEGIVVANGIYDIASAVGILLFYRLPALRVLANLHIKMFRFDEDRKNATFRRALAYWIFTYGCIRMAILARTPLTDYLAIVSYLIEATVYLIEDAVHTRVDRKKAIWVCSSSILLGASITFC